MSHDRMETVLRLRRLRERELRIDLGAAIRRATDAAATLDGARLARASHRDIVRDIASLQLARTLAIGLQHDVEAAEADLAAAEVAQQRALEAWQVARAEERAVERLVDRRREQERVEALTAELAEMDELALLGRTGGR